ncbi:MAG: 2,3-epoxybenzoyl-CoA dihydrolase [Pseudomonadota bacterium]
MAEEAKHSGHPASEQGFIDFRTEPNQYCHWQLSIEEHIAWLGLSVDEHATLASGYELKLNSYDLSVDIELADAIARIRFEHPEVRCVVVHSLNDRVFCAGANIKMLGLSSHAHKVNFCKFTNETRNAMEEAEDAGLTFLAAIKGSCAGGGYELALACSEIILADDGSSAVSLPELPLLAVLPGTGGLTRLVDKRMVRRDRADFFCTTEEGIRGQRAVDWRLVDEIVPASKFDERVRARAEAITADNPREVDGGVALPPLKRELTEHSIAYDYLSVEINRALSVATFNLQGPAVEPPANIGEVVNAGANYWYFAMLRALDDAILHLRFNEPEIGTWCFQSAGDLDRVLAYDAQLLAHRDHWFADEVMRLAKRVLKRIDVSARSLIAAIEPASCFGGTLFELVLAADQSFMLLGQFEDDEAPPAAIALSAMNFGPLPMVSGISRLQARYMGEEATATELKSRLGTSIDAESADQLGLVSFIPDDIDWEDEIRIVLEARSGFSPDALTGMEASLRFPGPETLESKIFSRLSAWQNWIFQRPNAVGDDGALVLYGTGQRPKYDKRRA